MKLPLNFLHKQKVSSLIRKYIYCLKPQPQPQPQPTMAYHVKAHSTTTTASNYYTRNSHEIEARKPMIATRSTPHFYF